MAGFDDEAPGPLFPPLLSGEATDADPLAVAVARAEAGTDAGLIVHRIRPDHLKAAIVFAPEVALTDAMAMVIAAANGFGDAFGAPPTTGTMRAPLAPSSESAGPDPSTPPPPSFRSTDTLFLSPYREFKEAWTESGEREYIKRLLARHDGNVSAAAKEAGVDRTYIYRLARRHGL